MEFEFFIHNFLLRTHFVHSTSITLVDTGVMFSQLVGKKEIDKGGKGTKGESSDFSL